MAATVDRPVTLARAEGLELLGDVSGSGYKEGAALVRRADGQMVQLGPLMYSLLEAIDGERDQDALAAAMQERLGKAVEPEHVNVLAAKLEGQGLLEGSEENAPPRLNPLLALRWKVLITDPRITDRITAPFKALFATWLVLPVIVGFAAVFWFVLIHKGIASATAQAFHSPELLLLVLGLGIASAGVPRDRACVGVHASAAAGPAGMGAGDLHGLAGVLHGRHRCLPAPARRAPAHRPRRALLQRGDRRGYHARGVARRSRRRAAAARRGLQILEMVKNSRP